MSDYNWQFGPNDEEDALNPQTVDWGMYGLWVFIAFEGNLAINNPKMSI